MNREEFRAKANLELISESKLLFLVEKPGEPELGRSSVLWSLVFNPNPCAGRVLGAMVAKAWPSLAFSGS